MFKYARFKPKQPSKKILKRNIPKFLKTVKTVIRRYLKLFWKIWQIVRGARQVHNVQRVPGMIQSFLTDMKGSMRFDDIKKGVKQGCGFAVTQDKKMGRCWIWLKMQNPKFVKSSSETCFSKKMWILQPTHRTSCKASWAGSQVHVRTWSSVWRQT